MEGPRIAILETNNLKLCPCTPADRADFIDLERDPEVMHFLNGGAVDHENTDPDKVNFLMPKGTEPYVWTARCRETGDFVGWFCLFPETKKLAEIGYRLRRNAWGQGLASEGAASLVDWGFNHADYETVVACTMTMNYGSRRVMEKIGMRYIKTVSLDAGALQGGKHEEVWYEVTRREWADKRGGSNNGVENPI